MTIQERGEVVQAHRVEPWLYEVPVGFRADMRVPARIFADSELLAEITRDRSLVQLVNVTTLPGITYAALGMPDMHEGYGFPVGGVAATVLPDGVISPGGIGFDINCGVRLLRSDLRAGEVRQWLSRLADALADAVPSGLGVRGGVHLDEAAMNDVLNRGAAWAVERGHGWHEDLDRTEEGGAMAGAEPAGVSRRARDRGKDQLGTLGSGNHFLEVATVDRLDDPAAAEAFGLAAEQVTVMIHCGSRGLGHQVCTDHVAIMDRALGQFGIVLPDRQLACAPLGTPQASNYLGAMIAAANFGWANRQVIAAAVRDAFARTFGRSAEALGLRQVYDLSHNIAKFERHVVGGTAEDVLVHRKGATRSFPAGHPDVPDVYRDVGQPVLVPGDMGRHSFVAVGAPGALAASFGSSCHGAGRAMSRHAAHRALRGTDVAAELGRLGIEVRAERPDLLSEEASIAYKDVETVLEVSAGAGLVRSVARLRPLAVIKG